MNAAEKLKRALVAERGACDAGGFVDTPHGGGLEAHHVLHTKGHAVTAPQKRHLEDPVNVALLCHRHHGELQHSKAFRAYWKQRAAELYGSESVDAYLRDWPTKLNRHP